MWPLPHDPRWRRCRRDGVCERQAPDLLVRHFTVPLPGPAGPPFTLAFFSDLHWDGEPAARLRALVATANAAAVDVVVFGGDLAASLHALPGALRQLAGLRARQACLAVRGNRESACAWLGPAFWRERYGAAGFGYLENEIWTPLGGAPGPVIVGVDDARHGHPDFGAAARAAASGRTVLTVTHNPDAVAGRGDLFLGHLLLCGHTHGGQWRLPGLGAVFTSSRYWRQFDRGWRRHDSGALLYITAGSGETGFKLARRRLFCPPELVLFTLVGDGRPAAACMETP